MGSWNATCAISNLHITYGQQVAVFMLAENKNKKSFCYNNALYDVCPIGFFGQYNDYGAVENCSGAGLDIVINSIKEQLYEFGQGPNSCHDIPVNKENFDINLLFEADHEDRLGIQYFGGWSRDDFDHTELERRRLNGGLTSSQQFELDRLAAKISKKDAFRRITHVVIHGDIFDSIMEKWYIEDYVGNGKGNVGHNDGYIHIYYKDIINSIPEYIDRIKSSEEKNKDEPFHRFSRENLFTWNDTCLAGRWMRGFNYNSSNNEYSIVNVNECVNSYIESGDWDGLAIFAEEVLSGAWINSFMSHTHKVWTKQTNGSQEREYLGHEILINSIADIIKAEKAEYSDECLEDEE